jgi:hypothetical protein
MQHAEASTLQTHSEHTASTQQAEASTLQAEASTQQAHCKLRQAEARALLKKELLDK